MCGIAGAVGIDVPAGARAVSRMCEQMLARGPDHGGLKPFERPTPVVLGSRRLAIIDPSPAGHQPMSDPERGTTLVFNGMIYNFRELRARLAADGAHFVSESDTEVVLQAYRRYGVDCVRHLRGMFAFAVWDAAEQRLFLARDRLGIKPLYYSRLGGGLLFASQVKALLASGLVERRLSPPGIASFLAFGAVSEPHTAVEGVAALPAGSRALFGNGQLEIERYWEPPVPEERALDRPQTAKQFHELLDDATRSHLVSDAPLGVFLSGGLDSSLLAAIAAKRTPHVRTVSVVFGEKRLSEDAYSQSVARHIGSDHVRVELTAADLHTWLPRAFDAMDQPTFDGINTYVVSRAAAESGLKVALSGLGADELFNGYGYGNRVARLELVKRLPAPVAAAAARLAGSGSSSHRTAKLSAWLSPAYERGSAYDLLRGLFVSPELARLTRRPGRGHNGHAPAADVAVRELDHYLKNVLLRDTDAMSMGSSVEVRVPYLDDAVVDWSLRLPRAARRSKALLAEVGASYLPREITSRPKHGFLLPLESWLRNEYAAEVEHLILAPPAELAELVERDEAAAVWRAYRENGHGWLRPWALYALARWTVSLP